MQRKSKLDAMALKCDAYFREKVFPLWLKKGGLGHGDGFLEEFIIDGYRPNTTAHRRLRVQGRQVWSFAKAYALGYGEELLELAKDGWQAIDKQFRHKDGGFIHSVDAQATPLNTNRFLYEQTFVLLGLSALYGATKNDEYMKQAHDLFRWIKKDLGAEEGFYTSFDNKEEPRQQNPHMHLFEALMALFEESGDEYWLVEAGKIYDLFHKYFFDEKYLLLREFFTSDLKDYDKIKGDSIEPGHNYEWVWLVYHYSQLVKASYDKLDFLYAFALKGTNVDGLGYDECLPSGEPVRRTSRMWVQTEALKANITKYEITQEAVYLDKMEQIIDNLFAYYLFDNGLWGDQIDENKQELSQVTPASTFYHLFLAFAEVIRLNKSVD